MGTVEARTGAYLGDLQLVQDEIDESVFGLSVDAHIPHGEAVNGEVAACDYVLIIVSFLTTRRVGLGSILITAY